MKSRKNLALAGVAGLALAGVALMFGRSEAHGPAVTRTVVAASATNRESRVFAPAPAVAAVAAPASEAPLSARGTKTVRVTSERTMTSALRGVLTDLGARVIAPVGGRAVIVEATPGVCARISHDVRFEVEDVLPAAKVQGTLAEMCAEKAEKTVPVAVVGLAAADRATLSDWVVSEGGTLRQGPDVPEILYAEIPTGLVASLAGRGDVRWIEYCPDYKLLNDRSVVAAAANVDTVRTVHMLRGRGQTVAIYDSGFDTGDKDNCHLDFADRVKDVVNEKYTKADYAGHGTHCAGTILGDGARSGGQYKGMAPEAQLFVQSAGDTYGSEAIYLPGTPERIFASCLSYDAYVHSDSWGNDLKGEYTTMCSGLDGVMWDHPELLVVVASGNDGRNGMGTVGSPAAAKNALTVGNGYSTRSGDPEDLYISSSRGPTKDARIKPEIVAPGTFIYSTRSSLCREMPIPGNSYYTEMTGTSMATPLVSGAAALVRQWLVDRRDFTNALPTAALIKAILTGGGVAMTGSCGGAGIPASLPNNYIGWGRLNLEKTLYPTDGCAVRFADRIPFRDGVTETIDLTTTNAAPLDVQLCWIDYAADASAAHTLINDLDLIVSNKTTGAVWYGNGVTDGDHTNTTESVRIPLADQGEYAILVRGHAVPHDSTEGGAAAVYIRGAFEDETKPDPEFIRNATTGERFETLDEAVGALSGNAVLEILQPVRLAKSVALPAGLEVTLVATNADPTASAVICAGGATLTVASGSRLILSNVVFGAAGNVPAVTVAAGGQIVPRGKVGVGTVSISDAGAVVLQGGFEPVGDGFSVDFPAGCRTGDAFGAYTCDYLTASNAASRIFNVRDPDLGGVAVEGSGTLVWGLVPIRPEDAVCALETEDGPAYYRSFRRLMQDALDDDAFVTIMKDDVCSDRFTLAHDLTVASANGSSLALKDAAGFVIPTGTKLTVTNVTVSGVADAPIDGVAFSVTGGSLSLENGATLSGLCDRYAFGKAYGGAIAVFAGSVSMARGATITGCQSQSNGGAIWLGGANCTADLLGGMIANCWASSAKGGGAVYAAKGGSVVNVAGDFTATANTMGTQKSLTAGNLYLAYDTVFTLVDEATGRVGVSFSVKKDEPDRNLEDESFLDVDPGVSEEAATASASRFVSDVDDELYGRFDDVEGAICWLRVQADGQVSPFVANVIVEVDGESVPRYYAAIDDAFSYVKEDATFRLLSTDWITHDVEIFGNVRLIGGGYLGGVVAIRVGDAVIHVAPGGSLSVSNIAVSCASYYFAAFGFPSATKSIFSVGGGSLTLERGAIIGGIYGDGSRAANAISVWNGGTMTMLPGSWVSDCHNLYSDPAVATGCGGGVLADRSILYLRGGEIEFSSSYRGGGLCVANGSTAYISGNFVVTNNTDLSGVNLDNITVSRNSQLIVDDAFTGAIGYNEGIKADTNWFGTVTWDWPSVEALTNCAARFVHDKTGARGVAVTNGVDKTAVLVWSDWISRAGRYVSPDGDVYRVCLAPGQTFAVPRDFSVAPTTTADGRRVLALDGGVDGCWYTVWSTESLAEPFVEERSVHLKAGETFEFEIDPTAASKFYKVVAEEGIK